VIDCEKRQKVVKRSEGITILRCMNTRCGMHGQVVDEGICSRCPNPVTKHVRPCLSPTRKDTSHVTSQELTEVSDDEVLQMMKDSGMDVEGSEDHKYPQLTVQLWNYKEAFIKWMRAGKPVRTKEEVEHIHTTWCDPCEWYDKQRKRCKGCGCKVTLGSVAIMNKIKMGTEHCPKNKW